MNFPHGRTIDDIARYTEKERKKTKDFIQKLRSTPYHVNFSKDVFILNKGTLIFKRVACSVVPG